MNSFNKINVASASTDKTKVNLSFTHLTTMNFGEVMPLANWDCIPGDQFSVNYSSFSRCAPMVLPTYGDAQFKTLSFFVPYYQVAEDFDAWVAGKSMYKGKATSIRTFNVSTMINLFTSYSTRVSDASAAYDFCYFNGDEGEYEYYRLNPKGKNYYKVFRSLGYQIPHYFDINEDNTKLNALPLLCYVKAINDYMSQSVIYDNSAISGLLKRIADGDVKNIDIFDLGILVRSFSLLYDQDYFTSAWATPTSPLSNTSISVKSDMLAGYSELGVLDTGRGGFPGLSTYHPSVTSILQNDLDVLKSFDAWCRRNAYSGSRTLEQIYSRYGIKVEDFDVEYADLIGSSSTPLQVGDITSTAATGFGEGLSQVGEYAGKGIINGKDGFNYRANDFGQLIVLGYISVKPMYADGFDRQVLKTDPLDFYQPEYDGIGVNAISVGEVACCPHNLDPESEDVAHYDDTFGFCERYNEYRTGKDKVTGDMCLQRYEDANLWHFNRNLSSLVESDNLHAQSTAFLEVNGDEYNKIFNIVDDSEDKFYMTINFGVTAIRPIKSNSQTARLGDGNTTIHKNGVVVS